MASTPFWSAAVARLCRFVPAPEARPGQRLRRMSIRLRTEASPRHGAVNPAWRRVLSPHSKAGLSPSGSAASQSNVVRLAEAETKPIPFRDGIANQGLSAIMPAIVSAMASATAEASAKEVGDGGWLSP